MNTRTLINGTEVPELDIPIVLTVKTKCPWKYKLIDMETGQVYIGRMAQAGELDWIKFNEH